MGKKSYTWHELKLRELDKKIALNDELQRLQRFREELEANNRENQVRDRMFGIPPSKPATDEEIMSYAKDLKKFNDSSPQRMQQIRNDLETKRLENETRRRLRLPLKG